MSQSDPPLPLSARSTEGLRAGDAAAVGLQVADLKASSLPLASGLRAIAADAPTRRLSQALNRLAIRLEQGSSLEGALGEANGSLPPAIKSILANNAHDGRGGLVLIDFLSYRAKLSLLNRMARVAAFYPICVILGVLVAAATMSASLGIAMVDLATEFDIELPISSRVFAAVGRQMPTVLLTCAGITFVAGLVIRFGLSRAERTRLYKRIPLFGPLWRFLGFAQWSKLLALELEAATTLPRALRDAGVGIDDADLGQASVAAAGGIELGIPLGETMISQRAFAASMPPMLDWAEQARQLPETLHAMADLFEARARRQVVLIEVVLPAIAFLIVIWSVSMIASVLVSPLVQAISFLN